MPMRGMEGVRQHYVEYDFKENVLAPLDEVEVVDGKVVPKKNRVYNDGEIENDYCDCNRRLMSVLDHSCHIISQ